MTRVKLAKLCEENVLILHLIALNSFFRGVGVFTPHQGSALDPLGPEGAPQTLTEMVLPHRLFKSSYATDASTKKSIKLEIDIFKRNKFMHVLLWSMAAANFIF